MVAKLAYVGDVPVSATSSGMLVLYRQLDGYPSRSLTIFETTPSPNEFRLPGVSYRPFGTLRRLSRTRLHSVYTTMAIAISRFDAGKVARALAQTKPDAVLTVSHGASWLVADHVSSLLGIPLILFSHDYWAGTCPAPGYTTSHLHSIFGETYRKAKVRFCISPKMENYYHARYGVAGTVLYPVRAELSPSGLSRIETPPRPFTVAYAGTITHEGYSAALLTLTESLNRIGGTLLLYTNAATVKAHKLAHASNLIVRDFVPPNEIVGRLRSEADALFLPMPSAMGINARLAFPSKLADYTSASLPIIVQASMDSGVFSWAKTNPAAAIAIPEGDVASLDQCIRALAADQSLRILMGRAAFNVGAQQFDGQEVRRQMLAAIHQHTVP